MKTSMIIRLTISGFALFASAMVQALSLGQIHVESYIDEPLRAVIDLNDSSAEELKSLNIKLASEDVFKRIGIDRNHYHEDLRFELSKIKGKDKVLVRSAKNINEPYLSFIVNASWSSGETNKEYTVLLDPPYYSRRPETSIEVIETTQVPQVIRPVSEPETEKPPTAEAAQKIKRQEQSEQSQDKASLNLSPKPDAEPQYGPTVRGDNLWTIAKKYRYKNTSMQQMMIAIQEANKEAFIRGNINLLKQGVVLRIPPNEIIEAISQRAAERRVARHERAWRAGRRVKDTRRLSPERPAAPSKPEQPIEKATAQTQPKQAEIEAGRLELVSAGDSVKNAASSTQVKTNEELNNALIQAREASTKAAEENKELTTRVEMLEDQLKTQKHLLELKDDQLKRLQDFYRQLSEEKARMAEKQSQIQAEQPVQDQAKAVDPEVVQTPVEQPQTPKSTDISQPEVQPEIAGQTPEQKITTEPQVDVADKQFVADKAPEAKPAISLDTERPASLEESPDALKGSAADTSESPGAQAELEKKVQPEEVQIKEGFTFVSGFLKSENFQYWATGLLILMLLLLLFLYGRRRSMTKETLFDEEEAQPGVVVSQLDDSELVDPIKQAENLIRYNEAERAVHLMKNALKNSPDNLEYRIKLIELLAQTQDKEGFTAELHNLKSYGYDKFNPDHFETLKEKGAQFGVDTTAFKEPTSIDEQEAQEAKDTQAQTPEKDTSVADVEVTEIEVEPSTKETTPELELSLTEDAAEEFDKEQSALMQDDDTDTLEYELDIGNQDFAIEYSVDSKEQSSASGNELTDDFDTLLDDALQETDLDKPDSETPQILSVEEDQEQPEVDESRKEEITFEFDDDPIEEHPAISKDDTDDSSDLDIDLPPFILDDDADISDQELSVKPDSDTDFAIKPDEDAVTEEVLETEPEDGDFHSLFSASSGSEIQVKLELAEAFAEMGDIEGAVEILDEVSHEGSDEQRKAAQAIRESFS